MAILSTQELRRLRNACERADPAVNYTKDQLNAASQALEDQWNTMSRGIMNGVINPATSPLQLGDTHKQTLLDTWLKQRAARGG